MLCCYPTDATKTNHWSLIWQVATKCLPLLIINLLSNLARVKVLMEMEGIVILKWKEYLPHQVFHIMPNYLMNMWLQEQLQCCYSTHSFPRSVNIVLDILQYLKSELICSTPGFHSHILLIPYIIFKKMNNSKEIHRPLIQLWLKEYELVSHSLISFNYYLVFSVNNLIIKWTAIHCCAIWLYIACPKYQRFYKIRKCDISTSPHTRCENVPQVFQPF